MSGPNGIDSLVGWHAGQTAEESRATARRRTAPDPWKDVVLDALVVAGIYREAHDRDPLLALRELLAWETAVALDPQVSSEARALTTGRGCCGECGRQAADGHSLYCVHCVSDLAKRDVSWERP